MITETILDDIFNIGYKATDVLIDHVVDLVYDHGFEIDGTDNYDTSVYINFSLDLGIGELSGSLVIHRIHRKFEVAAKLMMNDEEPFRYVGIISDDFKNIEDYLNMLRHDCLQHVEKVCLETGNYRWDGLRFRAPAS